MPSAAAPCPSGALFSVCRKRQQFLLTSGLWITWENTHQAPNTVSGTRVGIKVCFFSLLTNKKAHSFTSSIVLWNEVRN